MGFEVTFSPTSLRKSGENSIIFYIYRGNPWGICVDFLLVLARQALRLSSLLRGSRSILRGFSVDFAWILGRFSVDFAWIFFLRFSKAGYSFGPLFWSKIVGVRDKWILVR
jgi:hypothetical protein